LLHGYIAEAATESCTLKLADKEAEQTFANVARLAKPDAVSDNEAGKFALNEGWVHLFKK
jgi:hypothetical protein